MAEFTLVEPGDNLHDAHNKILLRDAGKANYGTAIRWTDFDGTTRDRRTGEVTSTGDHTLIVENQAGEHILVTSHVDGRTLFEVDEGAGVTVYELKINDWKVAVSGDDLQFKDDGGVVKVTFGDSSSTYALDVNGNTRTTALIVNDWTLVVSGDDLLFQDDAGSEVFRVGDTSSTYRSKTTGPSQITGLLQLGGTLDLGGTISSAGTIRGTNTTSYYARNNANSADVRLIAKTSGDVVQVGDGTNTVAIAIDSSGGGNLNVGGASILGYTSTYVAVTGYLSASSFILPGAVSGTPNANSLYQQAIVKGWCVLSNLGSSPPTIDASYNVAAVGGVSRNGTGDYTINWDRDFSSTAYCVQATSEANAGYYAYIANASFAAGATRIQVRDAGGTVQDGTRLHVLAIGVQ